jgi:hypothetical protein
MGAWGSSVSDAYGEAKQQGAYQFILEMLPIWEQKVAKFKKEIPWRKLRGTAQQKLAAKA